MLLFFSLPGEGFRRGIDVLVGTPGRIIDWIERGALQLDDLEHVVLDEVDRMLDMGFADDVDKILRHRYKKGRHVHNAGADIKLILRLVLSDNNFHLSELKIHMPTIFV